MREQTMGFTLQQIQHAASSSFVHHLAALIALGAATVLCELLSPFLLHINLLMIYLVTVVIAALNLHLQSALVTVVGGALIYNYLYIAPRYAFNFEEKEYLATFFGFLVTGVVISSLTKHTRDKGMMLELREAETANLYELSRKLAAACTSQDIADAVINTIEGCSKNRAALFLEIDGRLRQTATSSDLLITQEQRQLITKAFKEAATSESGYQYGNSLYCEPIRTPSRVIGILVINAEWSQESTPDHHRRLIASCADQAGMALERVRLVHETELANNEMARQKLERALLNSVSHDLRTPLATITGVISSVLDEGELLDSWTRNELLENARAEAERLNCFVGKLLDITRLQAHAVVLKIELCDVQDLIGCALTAMQRLLQGRQVQISQAEGLPLVPMDMVLMNQVLVNLLDNAHKYSPPDRPIQIAARCNEGQLVLQVIDQGPGVPEHELVKIFDKFYRIAIPEGIKGTGLGLSICHGIVEAHGGSIYAENLQSGGFCITIHLPLQQSNHAGDAV
jgi:two-component system sensor histidine kinase KdpD